jgi:hypothetical protein
MIGVAAMVAAPLLKKLFSSGPTMQVVDQRLATFSHQLASLPSTNIVAIRGNLINTTNTLRSLTASVSHLKPTTLSWDVASGKIVDLTQFIQQQQTAQAALTASTTVLGKTFAGVAASTIAQAAASAHINLARGFTPRQVTLLAQTLVTMGVISQSTATTIEGSSKTVVAQWQQADAAAKKVDLVPPLNLTQTQLTLVKKAIKTTSTLAVASFINSTKNGKAKFTAAAAWMHLTSKRLMGQMKTDFTKGGQVSMSSLEQSLMEGRSQLVNTGGYAVVRPVAATMANIKTQFGKTGVLAMQLLGTGMQSSSPAVQQTVTALLTTLHKTASGHLDFSPEGQAAAKMLAAGLQSGTAHMVQVAEWVAANAANAVKHVDFTSAGQKNAKDVADGLKHENTFVFTAAQGLAMNAASAVKGVDFTSAGRKNAKDVADGLKQGHPVVSTAAQAMARAARGYAQRVDFGKATTIWIRAAATGMTKNQSTLSNAATDVVHHARTAMSGVHFHSTGFNIATGVAQGILSGSSVVVNAMVSDVSNALAAAQHKAGIKSPSVLFASEVGLPIAQGIALGVAQGVPTMTAAAETAVTAMRSSLVTSKSKGVAFAYTMAMRGAYSQHAGEAGFQGPGGGNITITAPVTVHSAGGTPRALGESVAANISKTLVTALKAKGGSR